jgi:GTP-binding protein
MVVDLSADDPPDDLATLRRELAAYDPALAERHAVVVGSKADLVDEPAVATAALGPDALAVSAMTGEGVEPLVARLGLLAEEAVATAPERTPYVVLRPARPSFAIERDGRRFHVSGRTVERWVADTDMDDEQAVEALQRKLIKEGVERWLAEAGARRGDEVVIGGIAFDFIPEEEGSRGR